MSKITTDFVTNIILCTLIKIYSFFILLPNTSLTVVIFQPTEFFVCCSFDCFICLKCVTVVSITDSNRQGVGDRFDGKRI